MKKSKNIDLHKAAIFYGIMILVAIFWIKIFHLDITVLGLKGFLSALFLGIIVFILSQYVGQKYRWAQDLENIFAEVLLPLELRHVFLLAAMSSIAEELLFRGAIQTHFGIIIASVLFGLMHFPIQRKLLPWTISATFMGFVLGLLYIYSGNLVAPIVLHFLINLLNLWAIQQKNQKFD